MATYQDPVAGLPFVFVVSETGAGQDPVDGPLVLSETVVSTSTTSTGFLFAT